MDFLDNGCNGKNMWSQHSSFPLFQGGGESPDKSIGCGCEWIIRSIIEQGAWPLFVPCSFKGSLSQGAAPGGSCESARSWVWEAEWASSFKHLASTFFFCQFEFHRHSIGDCWHAKETGSLRLQSNSFNLDLDRTPAEERKLLATRMILLKGVSDHVHP